MRSLLHAVILAAAAGAASAASPSFSAGLPAADFAAAGLGKLTPAERAHLDLLVAGRAPAPAAPGRPAVPAPAVSAGAPAGPSPGAGNWLGRARVLLQPGTQVEYAPVQGRLAGTFTGWSAGTIFVLEDGQRWRVADAGSSYFGPPIERPAASIRPAAFGSFWLEIEGVSVRVKVLPVAPAN